MEVPREIVKNRGFPNATIKYTNKAVVSAKEPVKVDKSSTKVMLHSSSMDETKGNVSVALNKEKGRQLVTLYESEFKE